jgi:hypothetical protein
MAKRPRRQTRILVVLNEDETAVLDERRGAEPRAVHLRRLLHEPAKEPDVATRRESLAILTSLARDGSTVAAVSLAKELREQPERDIWEWVRHGDG